MSGTGVFAGVRVIELAQYVYVPGAGVMLADQGAEVIKIEAIGGDPYRTLRVGTDRNLGDINIAMEQNNRNKKSIALDLKAGEGREALLRLVETADVFLTSLRPRAIAALGLDVDALRARNPKIIYARGNGVGFRGAEANRPGFDASAFWARGGACHAFTRPGQQPTSPRPAYGDHTGSLAIAYGIAGALFRRAMTGEPSVVENSLLATACWVLSADLTMTQLPHYETHPAHPIRRPLTYAYATRDGKLVQLMILNPAPRWAALCGVLGLEHIVDDPRFADEAARNADPDPLIALIAQAFARRDFAEWRPLLEAIDIPWELISSIEDVANDPQVAANAMMQDMAVGDSAIRIVAGPTAFDGAPIHGRPRPSPALGAHTAELLGELGYDAAVLADLRARGVAG
ncbi:CaiB/BaiF CoA transferase family protein [Novosphingobium album (ex Liu et al. 2023)]|uniref:CoA transferase n=1 Tax=Novosphingobium album (ex Liu et al. 2023) TaxID=3031130 RepID=A0ABT5WXI1_9SPHN|nr:CoA transferase [Novosphingobium album (ex Liu et al. 2023)]MDE8654587.1 CoA transferase [Novosphingobium album (ex Liu et al. 2023)]